MKMQIINGLAVIEQIHSELNNLAGYFDGCCQLLKNKWIRL